MVDYELLSEKIDSIGCSLLLITLLRSQRASLVCSIMPTVTWLRGTFCRVVKIRKRLEMVDCGTCISILGRAIRSDRSPEAD